MLVSIINNDHYEDWLMYHFCCWPYMNTDIDLEDCSSVTKLRETLLCSLDDCVSSIRSSLNSSLHVSQMLLCLPLLRQTDGAIRRFWINVRRDGKVPMNKLFVEMLESNIALRWSSSSYSSFIKIIKRELAPNNYWYQNGDHQRNHTTPHTLPAGVSEQKTRERERDTNNDILKS